MNIFYKISLQGLRKNRTRTLVTVVGVALSAALFTAVAAFGTSLIAFMNRCEIARGGNWHIVFSKSLIFLSRDFPTRHLRRCLSG